MNVVQGLLVLAGLGLSKVTNEWSMIFSGIFYRFAA